MTPLTTRQAETLEAIRRLSAGGIAPTYAEIRTAIGCRWSSSMQKLIAALVRHGAITMVPAKARSIRIIEGW